MLELDVERAMAVARQAAEAASAAALVHFRRGVRVEVKPDRSPVTAADRDAEAAALAVIRASFPGHALLGEESGAHQGDAETRGFTRGGSFWGPMIGLEHRGVVVAGAMALPALGEVFWAGRGLGAWISAAGGKPRRLQVSGISDWHEATFSMGEPRALLAPELAGRVAALATTSAVARCYGDLAGAAMVLTGRAEAWVESGVQAWDLGPIPVLVEEAGGRFSDFEGRPSLASGRCIASNGLVHEHLLRHLGA